MPKRTLLPFHVMAIISAAMFSSHFGVGDLIFPPNLGRNMGTNWFIAALGYMLINSVGVWLAYLACARQNKSLTGIATDILGTIGGKIYTAIHILITVFFILPRVSSATHEMAIAPLLPKGHPGDIFSPQSLYRRHQGKGNRLDRKGSRAATDSHCRYSGGKRDLHVPASSPGIRSCSTERKYAERL